MNEQEIWGYLYPRIGNACGTAALMGNLRAESGLNPKNLQDTYETRLGMNDEQYTQAVDSGAYANFVKDGAGYGLAQWTYHSRKQNLLNFAKQHNESVGSLRVQLDFLWEELQGYKTCLEALKTASDIRVASDVVMDQYEQPSNRSEDARQKRADFGQQYLQRGSIMISLNTYLSCIQQNVNRVKSYVWGKDGSDGTCDCIGLIIGALKLAGGTWPGVHGSNWAWRNAIDNGGSTKNGVYLGEIVFKAKAKGESGYDLPDQYKSGKDLNDYYHVGIVTSVTPLCITHCTSVRGGIKKDTELGKWAYGGRLKYVNYEYSVLYQATVHADSGSSVRMRVQPDVNSSVKTNVPVGATVDVLAEQNDWFMISYSGNTGYMMKKFLAQENSAVFTLTQDQLNTLKNAAATIQNILNTL